MCIPLAPAATPAAAPALVFRKRSRLSDIDGLLDESVLRSVWNRTKERSFLGRRFPSLHKRSFRTLKAHGRSYGTGTVGRDEGLARGSLAHLVRPGALERMESVLAVDGVGRALRRRDDGRDGHEPRPPPGDRNGVRAGSRVRARRPYDARRR